MRKWFPMISTVLLMVGAAIIGATVEDLKFIQYIAILLVYAGGILTGIELFKN